MRNIYIKIKIQIVILIKLMTNPKNQGEDNKSAISLFK